MAVGGREGAARERQRLLEQGLFLAFQRPEEAGEEQDGVEEDDLDQRMQIHGELGALLQELARLQCRMASLLEKIGSLPLDIIRSMREEVVQVTDQLRNLNRLQHP
uniref:Uncharacterized protein n=1 Tax=Nymphaea colorata TaxID=210225 RepID=A0A5K1AAM7_9MAGN